MSEQDIPDRPDHKTGMVALIFLAAAAIGIGVAHYFVVNFADARASHNWPPTQGVILNEPEGQFPTVRYSYSVEGSVYVSTRNRVVDMPFARRPDVTPGDRVRVYVNPMQPTFAVLTPGGAIFAYIAGVIFGAGMTFVGLGGLVWVAIDYFGVTKFQSLEVER